MEELKAEKRKSYWLGLLIGVLVSGFVLTVVFCVLFSLQADDFKEYAAKIENGQVISSQGNTGSSSGVAITGSLVDQTTMDKMNFLMDEINNCFLFEENIDVEKIRENMYYAMFNSLDDVYSEYYSPAELAALNDESAGVYYGIGSYVSLDEATGYAKLTGVFEDSPASRAGLRDGDMICKVNGESIVGLTLTEVVTLIKGPENTDVVLTIVREGSADFDVTVTRSKVESPTVSYKMRDDKIGYIQIKEFDDVTTEQFKTAYFDLNSQDMEALIIDLRSNGGGNLSTVLEICEQILPKGMITYTLDKYGNREEFTCKGKTPIKIPLVVLTNGYTASASELMTGAIRDYGVGISMGTNTFGKGIVQTIIQLYDGSGFKLTSERYYTPNGVCIHGQGIAPDIEVEFDSEAYYNSENPYDNQLEAAHEYLKEQLNKQ